MRVEITVKLLRMASRWSETGSGSLAAMKPDRRPSEGADSTSKALRLRMSIAIFKMVSSS